MSMLGLRRSLRGWLATVFLLGVVQGAYLATPEFQWSIPLVSTATDNLFQKGNAIAQIGSDRLAITSSTGALYLVSPNNVTVNSSTGMVNSSTASKSFTPSLVSGMDSIACNGGIISVFSTSKTEIVMYAIVDTDSQDRLSSSSRIVAVDARSAQLIWNTTIGGTIVGTPVLSNNRFLYVVHNVVSGSAPNTVEAGVVSIFQLDANVFAWTDIRPTLITKLPTESTGRPFGPAAVATKDGSDLLFLAENMGETGETLSESLFVIGQISGTETFAFATASRGISSSSTPPTLRDNGSGELEVFLGQPLSTLLAWIEDDAALLITGLNGSSNSLSTPTWRFQTEPDSNSDAGTFSGSFIDPH